MIDPRLSIHESEYSDSLKIIERALAREHLLHGDGIDDPPVG